MSESKQSNFPKEANPLFTRIFDLWQQAEGKETVFTAEEKPTEQGKKEERPVSVAMR